MRSDEVRGTARLAGLAMGGGARRIAEGRRGIAGRVLGALGPAATPVRLAQPPAGPAQIRQWLESRPEGPRPTARDGVDGD